MTGKGNGATEPVGAVLAAALEAVQGRVGDFRPRVAIVLGSGLGGMAEAVSSATRIPYGDVPGFPEATVVGHAGELVFGELEGVPVALQSGRFHLYEGHTAGTVVLPVRLLAELGVETLIVTNAAGGLGPTLRPPALILIADHVNLMWRNPLIGAVEEGEERFPDMARPYDAELRVLAQEAARQRGIEIVEGVYAGVLGPSYETPAEISMLQRLGVDAVGMSTVPEVLVARARGLRVLGISSITNVAAGLSADAVSHDDVLEAGRRLAGDLEALIRGVLARLT